jgi:RimJ/RimL family protein N-acetyltransferase
VDEENVLKANGTVGGVRGVGSVNLASGNPCATPVLSAIVYLDDTGMGQGVAWNEMTDSPYSVKLRELKHSDLESVHGLLSDWSVVRYMLLPHCTTKEESRKCLEELITESPDAAWLSMARAIELRDSGDVIGLCGIAILHGSEQGELWYLVRPEYWGHGIAAEAARALLTIGFAEMKLHRMFATCLPENPASSLVLEKIGMRKEYRQSKNLKIHGVWHDCVLYALLREEWELMVNGGGPGHDSDG